MVFIPYSNTPGVDQTGSSRRWKTAGRSYNMVSYYLPQDANCRMASCLQTSKNWLWLTLIKDWYVKPCVSIWFLVGDLAKTWRNGVCSRRMVARGTELGQYRGCHSKFLLEDQLSCRLAQNCSGTTQTVEEMVQSAEGNSFIFNLNRY